MDVKGESTLITF